MLLINKKAFYMETNKSMRNENVLPILIFVLSFIVLVYNIVYLVTV